MRPTTYLIAILGVMLGMAQLAAAESAADYYGECVSPRFCHDERARHDWEWEQAHLGNLTAQGNLASCLISGCGGSMKVDVQLGCAWRLMRIMAYNRRDDLEDFQDRCRSKLNAPQLGSVEKRAADLFREVSERTYGNLFCNIRADMCAISAMKVGQDLRDAETGAYQAQRNSSYCLATGCEGAVEPDRILSCAWRLVRLMTGDRHVDLTDAGFYQAYCRATMDEQLLRRAEERAKELFQSIYRRAAPTVDPAKYPYSSDPRR